MNYTTSSTVGRKAQRMIGTATAAVAAATAAGVVGTTQTAEADIVYSGVINLAIPSDIYGIYLNFVTGVTGTTGAPGWDFNPYNNNTGLTFYGAASPSGILASGTPGTGAVALRLTGGELISSAGQYNQFQTQGTLFQSGGQAYVGLRFINESTGVLNYGWALISATGGNGFPASIVSYAYENAGGSIAAGATAVPEPSTYGLLAAGALGLLGLRRYRRAS